jgi:hypothetical protein
VRYGDDAEWPHFLAVNIDATDQIVVLVHGNGEHGSKTG